MRPPPPVLGAGPGDAGAAAARRTTSARSSSRSGGGSTPRSTSRCCGPAPGSVPSRRCSPARPGSSTTTRARTPSRAASTSSPTPAPRSACASCAPTASPTATAPTARARGLAENERFLRAGGRGLVGVHAAFTCSDDTLDGGRRAGRRPRRRRAHPRRRGAAGRRRPASGWRRWPPTTGCSCTASGSTATCPGTIAHNPRSNMNNGVGYARPARRPNDVVLGTDGIGADMLEEFRLAYVAHRADDVTAVARHGVVVADERLPASCRSAADDRVTWTYDHVDSPWHVAFTPGMRVTDVVAGDGEVLVADGRPDPGRPRRGPRPRRRAGGPALRPALSRPAGHRANMSAMSDYPVALYLQDAHDIRDGIELCAAGRGGRVRRRLAGRQPPRARRRRADGGVRRGDRPDQDRLRRHRHLDPQRGPPGQHVLDARRPRPGSHPVRPRRVVGPAGDQGRHRPGHDRCGRCARSSPPCAACWPTRP